MFVHCGENGHNLTCAFSYAPTAYQSKEMCYLAKKEFVRGKIAMIRSYLLNIIETVYFDSNEV